MTRWVGHTAHSVRCVVVRGRKTRAPAGSCGGLAESDGCGGGAPLAEGCIRAE